MSPKKRYWIAIATGALFLFAGLRDDRPGASEAVVYIILGLIFLGVAVAGRGREKRGNP